jgi:hypothetical protein
VTVHAELEETEDGVVVVLDDVDKGRRATVRYHYCPVGRLHVRHDVKEVVPLRLIKVLHPECAVPTWFSLIKQPLSRLWTFLRL